MVTIPEPRKCHCYSPCQHLWLTPPIYLLDPKNQLKKCFTPNLDSYHCSDKFRAPERRTMTIIPTLTYKQFEGRGSRTCPHDFPFFFSLVLITIVAVIDVARLGSRITTRELHGYPPYTPNKVLRRHDRAIFAYFTHNRVVVIPTEGIPEARGLGRAVGRSGGVLDVRCWFVPRCCLRLLVSRPSPVLLAGWWSPGRPDWLF